MPRSLKKNEIEKTTKSTNDNMITTRRVICAARRGSCVDTEGGIRTSVGRYNPFVKRDAASNPLTERYASREMSYLFSPDFKFRTWRRLWIALAEAERELGLPIDARQIEEVKASANDINYADAERREREIRHDVMSHIYAYGLQAPSAKAIIHLGATSAFVTDNTDILQMAEGLAIMKKRIVS